MFRHNALRTVAISAALTMAVAGCSEDDPETAVEAFEGQETVELLTGEPFEGTATVDKIVSEHAFYLLDTLVITADGVDVREDDLVEVTGEVADADVDTVEAAVGTSLDDEAKDAIADEDLVIVATSVEDAGE